MSKIFDEVGFDEIGNKLLKNLVISRLSFPASKLKTVNMLQKHQSIDIIVQDVYRYLDKLYSTHKELVQQINYQHTLKILGNVISIVFYDVTTLYFQIDNEDEIRKRDYNKYLKMEGEINVTIDKEKSELNSKHHTFLEGGVELPS